jgi:type III pantothenate kinase
LEGAVDKQHWLSAVAQAHGLFSHYKPAESLGTDRFAALVAARRRSETDWVVVNVGTAMTADMLTAEGHFLGGAIVPGPVLMRDALDKGTARVHIDEPLASMDVPGNTQSAVGQGIAWALWGVVEGMSRQLTLAVGRSPRILLSGGARGFLRPLLKDEVLEVDELVLEGLAWIARDLGYDA